MPVYQYFKDIGFLKVLIAFVLAQVAGSAMAVMLVEAVPGLKGKADAGFELLRAGPNLLLIAWFIYDMLKKHVDILGDFKNIPEQITVKDMGAILGFNILAGIFSVYGLIYATVLLFPPEKLTEIASANAGTATTTMVGVFLASIVAVLLAPPAEEAIFRGVLPAQIQRILPVWVSFLVSSALFSAIHFSASAITTFIFAITLCVVAYKTKNIAITIVLHMANNLFVSVVQIFNQVFAKEEPLNMSGMAQQFLSIGLPCLFGAVVLAYYLIKKREFFNLQVGFVEKN